ncbi:MAG: XdhC family protein [Phormidesmis sp. CAN_BIN44]|nr:XdhC family protein [Phormidesmis sp. CAN_BIN44]
MIEFYRQFAQWLMQEPVVLATVTRVQGSVPGEVGAKMIVCSDRIFGTIGGGAGEAKVIQQSRIVLETGQKQSVEIDLTGAPQRETQGICGGKMQVWLERWSGEVAIERVQSILHLLNSGQTSTLVTPFDVDRSPCLVHLAESTPLNAFVETLQPPPTLLIIGAGHVGEQLAKVAHLIGFQIMVQDDRAEWANSQRYPDAAGIFNGSITEVVEQFADHSNLYVALVTRGYHYDLAALECLLKRDSVCAYVGMIGSEKRVRQVYQALEKMGVSESKLKGIYAPIGLDIGALTPEEIAVSIAAELVSVRRGRVSFRKQLT